MFSRFLLFICFLILAGGSSRGQNGLCPPNLDFEQGDLTNWFCRTGTVSIKDAQNFVTWNTATGPVPGRHTIISSADAGTDPFGGFPQLCPNGSGYSMRLGNQTSNKKATSVSYTYTIPADLTTFSILFHYAVVLQNPDHDAEQQPRFRARIIDLSTNEPLPCVTFDFTASSSLPGFQPSRVNTTVLYKDWTPVSINLSSYIGRSVMLEFIATDCTLGAHFGYAYIDVNSACNGAIGGSTICIGDESITLRAPYGFESYEWFSDNTFTQSLSAELTLTLDPPPAVGTVFPVIVKPYPGFGCNDTLYATITIAAKPASEAGTDAALCKYEQVRIGAPAAPAMAYSWTPAGQVSNPFSSNPIAWNPVGTTETEFVVQTTDILTGCYAYDTVVVATKAVDIAVSQLGSNNYCFRGEPETVLSVSSSLASVQWYDGNTLLAGVISPSYTPPSPGAYWAAVTQDGCRDSTAIHNISFYPYPEASFYPDRDSGCVNSGLFTFTNTSSVSDASALSYSWQFSDGSSLSSADAVKSFSQTGPADIKLIASTPFGCRDSVTQTIMLLPNGRPDFTWDSACLNRPVLFSNLSNQNGWPRAQYAWEFNNGAPGPETRNPPPVHFTAGGWVDVTLIMTITGCENDPQQITQPVLVNRPADGIRYKDITVPAGQSWPVKVRDTVGNSYHWQPQVYLDDYYKSYARFFAGGGDVQYLVHITDAHTCITTDTLQLYVLKQPGYYLPTAFSPNGDGLNDVAIPYLVGMKALKSFTVFNRWGNRVFYTEAQGRGWDGKWNGQDQPPGVYVWILEFFTSDDKKVTEKGTITIVR